MSSFSPILFHVFFFSCFLFSASHPFPVFPFLFFVFHLSYILFFSFPIPLPSLNFLFSTSPISCFPPLLFPGCHLSYFLFSSNPIPCFSSLLFPLFFSPICCFLPPLFQVLSPFLIPVSYSAVPYSMFPSFPVLVSSCPFKYVLIPFPYSL
jgi:hypothetical protein